MVLDSQTVVSYPVGAGHRTWVVEEQEVFLTPEPSQHLFGLSNIKEYALKVRIHSSFFLGPICHHYLPKTIITLLGFL